MIEISNYIEISESELRNEVEAAFAGIEDFLNLISEMESEHRNCEAIVEKFVDLYRYAHGLRTAPVALEIHFSHATSFAIFSKEMSEGLEQTVSDFECMFGTLNHAWARFKFDRYCNSDRSMISVEACSGLFGEDDEQLLGLSTMQLAMLSGYKIQTVRNKLSEEKIKLCLNSSGKFILPMHDALPWLEKQPTFRMSNEIVETSEMIEVPIARDGSFFNEGLRNSKGFRIGKKGEEVLVDCFEDALKDLRRMPTPYWRRPSGSSGIPGIVKGVRWEARPLVDVKN
ncbi:MAG: hypothetical protein JJ956_08700 [Pseudomonadales bacterium]|nr:hypothetical protein [Pseudomonadales bacterium]